MINVTKTYLPPLSEYMTYLEQIWDRALVTNNGPLVIELEQKLKDYLKLPCVQFVSNGTIALQLALKALNISGEVITTPFSYVATTTAILWENSEPVFVDIDPASYCIDAKKIEAAITPKTKAILATHVYGIPCDVKLIGEIASAYNLKVIYDGAHAFGCRLDGASLLSYGDMTTLSFHATKIFHTIEGGAVVSANSDWEEVLWLLKSFGHRHDDYKMVGVNGKNSELHAAMGLCLLPRIDDFIERRVSICTTYDALLQGLPLKTPAKPENFEYNYAYYPVVFETESALLRTVEALQARGINPRRYFYPSLNKLPYYAAPPCPVSESVATRVLCLPLYVELSDVEVDLIATTVRESLVRDSKQPVLS